MSTTATVAITEFTPFRFFTPRYDAKSRNGKVTCFLHPKIPAVGSKY